MMSNILENLATIERALVIRAERFVSELAAKEDAAMLGLPMAQREELLAEAMTNAKHVYMKTLSKAQQQVAWLRLDIGDTWPDPDIVDSYIFLVSEIGEVGDALLRANYGHRGDYARNNSKQPDLVAELGDVYLMLCTLATCLGIDLDSALQGRIDHLKEKYSDSEDDSSSRRDWKLQWQQWRW